MPALADPWLLFAVLAGLVGGLVLLGRGLLAYRRKARVRSVATSRLDALAAGEVRITGTVEPLAMTLVSPLQSAPCVWYRASITDSGDEDRTVLDEERSVAFLVRDERGEVRVVPRDAEWEVDPVFDESADADGESPPGLLRNHGPSTRSSAPLDREAAIAELLTVRAPRGADEDGFRAFGMVVDAAGRRSGTRRYREARIEPGTLVTVIGQAVPAGDLDQDDPMSIFAAAPPVDPAIAADLAEAREAGILAPDAETAWGNAAIAGFGIERPVREPELDPAATSPSLATPAEVERSEANFEPPPESLVVTGATGTPMLVYAGPPTAAESSHDDEFAMGLAGAMLSVACAAVLAVLVRGGI
jgi:hypothetical protein